MKKSAWLLVSALFFLPGAVNAVEGNPHDFQTTGCTHCHIMVPGQSKIVQRNVFRRNIDSLCQECHAAALEDNLNHRVGIRPSMKVPEDLHLSATGEISCITCHNPHGEYLDKKTKTRTFFLRRPMLKRELCLACHESPGFKKPEITVEILTPQNNSILNTLPAPLIGKVSEGIIEEVNLEINDSHFYLNVEKQVFSTILTLKEGINEIRISAPGIETRTLNLFFNPSIPEDMTYRLYYSHGIVKKKDCFDYCHDRESRTYRIDENNARLCNSCHEQKNLGKYIHGPVAVGSCTVCHDPHGQTNSFLLVKSGEELCFKCHLEKDALRHLLTTGGGDNSFLRGKGCSYCHDPHSGERKFLLRAKI